MRALLNNRRKINKTIFLWISFISFSILSPMVQLLRAERVKYDSETRRDPFVSLTEKKKISIARTDLSGLADVASIDDIRLEGIVVDVSKGSIVIANGVVLREGESKDGVKAVLISENGVFFEIKGHVDFKPFSPETSTEGNQ